MFFDDHDRKSYLANLTHYAERHELAVLAYCLMSNHVHLVVVPATVHALERVLRPLNMRHAQRINRRKRWKGHLWQGRYFASALDERHLWAAIRYVELNPVEARLVHRAEDYAWSSAAAHCALRADSVLTRLPFWTGMFKGIGAWSKWLGRGEDPEERSLLRRNTAKGLPSGSPEFIERLEASTGRRFHDRSPGRPKKKRD